MKGTDTYSNLAWAVVSTWHLQVRSCRNHLANGISNVQVGDRWKDILAMEPPLVLIKSLVEILILVRTIAVLERCLHLSNCSTTMDQVLLFRKISI